MLLLVVDVGGVDVMMMGVARSLLPIEPSSPLATLLENANTTWKREGSVKQKGATRQSEPKQVFAFRKTRWCEVVPSH